jgi:TolB-like protein/DNA-binding winged helix-turn-helix (wHTH) protein/Tfp pilus assembly protein PilF
MIELSESRVYEFEEFRLDTKSRRLFLRETDELVPLTPKAVELLLFLVENRGEILTKDELLDSVWGNSFVEESNLSQTVFVLRKTLGENTKTPRFILTSQGLGYQFIADVREIVPGDEILDETLFAEIEGLNDRKPTIPTKGSKPKKDFKYLWLLLPIILISALAAYWFYPVSKPASVSEIKTIAVLPFEDLTTEQSEKYLGVSLADALVNRFSGLKKIVVRPTRTVLKYAGNREDPSAVGRELKVDAVLDGRIQRINDRVRVSVQLIRTSDNATIWTESFDDEFTNLFAVQDSISQKVLDALVLKLDPFEHENFNRRGTNNSDAYQEYLRGRFFWNKRTADDFQIAIKHFNKAIELDPAFAQAHSAIAETYVLVNLFATKYNPNAFPIARSAAEKALELNGNLALAHAALAQVKMQYDYDWAGTEREYLKAVELNPNDATVRQWYGEFLALYGRNDESIVQMEKARELDPTSLSTNNALALPLIRANQIEKALEVTSKVLEMDANFAWAYHYHSRALLLKGDYEKSVETCRKALDASNQSIFLKSNLAYALARAGNKAETRKILLELQEKSRIDYVSPYNFAIIHNALDEREETYKYLNQAIDERDSLIISLKGDTVFRNLHNDTKFKETLKRVNL